MRVSIKDLAVSMQIKNKGVELDVYDSDDTHLGDLVITKTRLIWCKGRTKPENGKKITWKAFAAYMDSRDRRPATEVGRRRRPERKVSARVDNGRLIVEFSGGPNRSWPLPGRSDKLTIREVRDKAVAFARDNEATPGQVAAVKKALTTNRYHIAK